MEQEKVSKMERTNAYRKEATEKIIQMIENGTAPWMKPWDSQTDFGMPVNGKSGRRYTGFNAPYLFCISEEKSFNDPRWYTFKQITEIEGLKLKKGSKGTKIEYWQWSIKDKEASKEAGKDIYKELKMPIRREYVIFNGSQIEGLEKYPYKKPELKWEPDKQAEQIIKANGVEIIHRANEAYYISSEDKIYMPHKEAFANIDGYYSTLLHEVAHSTGHKDRLDRSLINKFGSPEYAKEELRAELASMFLCNDIGISRNGNDEQHAAYIGSWIKSLKEDHNEIFRAAADADKICNYLCECITKVNQKEIIDTKSITKEPVLENGNNDIYKTKTSKSFSELQNMSLKMLNNGIPKGRIAMIITNKTKEPYAKVIKAVNSVEKQLANQITNR